jgi:hypothetical protein
MRQGEGQVFHGVVSDLAVGERISTARAPVGPYGLRILPSPRITSVHGTGKQATITSTRPVTVGPAQLWVITKISE